MNYPEISSNTALFFGSGVSIWSPCNIPMGGYISGSLLSIIFGEETISKFKERNLESYLSWIPFETINEYAPKSIDLAELYSNIFISREYNLLHDQLVRLASTKSIAALITTNYDNAVELVPDSERNLMLICDSRFSESDRIPYFKVHGSVTDSNSLVYKLSQEAVLEKWKEKYMHQLLNNHELVVIGYSGIDFEICPVIASSNVSIVYWGYKPGTPEDVYKTSGYRVIENSHQIIPFPINLQMGLPWFDQNADQNVTGQNDTIASCFNITSEEKMIWGFQLASIIGYSKHAIDVSRNEFTNHNPISRSMEKNLGIPLFESGQFVDSAHCFVSNALDKLRNKDSESCICSLLGAYDSYRAGGYVIKASVLLIFISFLSYLVRTPRIRTQTNIKVVTMIKSVKVAVQFVLNTRKLKAIKPIILPMLLKVLNLIAIKILDKTNQAAVESKCMFDIKNVDSLYSLFKNDAESTFSEVTSYRALGYYSASTALFRKNKLTDHPPQLVIDEACSLFRLMRLMDNHQEAWKVAKRMTMLTNGTESVKWEDYANYHLDKCQYSFLFKKYMPK
ncbi:hypothetical protein MASR1M36_16080 [Candidatus Cloacimonadaceae bacterium]